MFEISTTGLMASVRLWWLTGTPGGNRHWKSMQTPQRKDINRNIWGLKDLGNIATHSATLHGQISLLYFGKS